MFAELIWLKNGNDIINNKRFLSHMDGRKGRTQLYKEVERKQYNLQKQLWLPWQQSDEAALFGSFPLTQVGRQTLH